MQFSPIACGISSRLPGREMLIASFSTLRKDNAETDREDSMLSLARLKVLNLKLKGEVARFEFEDIALEVCFDRLLEPR